MALAEKLKAAELMAETSFIQKRRETELQAEARASKGSSKS